MSTDQYNFDEGYTPEDRNPKPYRPSHGMDRRKHGQNRQRSAVRDREVVNVNENVAPESTAASAGRRPTVPSTTSAAEGGAATSAGRRPTGASTTSSAERTSERAQAGSLPSLNAQAGSQPSQPKVTALHNDPRPETEDDDRDLQLPGKGVARKVAGFFTDERLRTFLGVVVSIVSVYVVVAIVSYFSHGGEDQSVVSNLTMTEAVEQNIDVGNAEGKLGAWWAQAIFGDALGLGSLVLLVYLLIVAGKLFGAFKKVGFWGLTFRSLLLAITVSIVFGLVTYNAGTVVNWGGNHGHYVNKFLIDYTSVIGAIFVSLLLLVAVALVYYYPLRNGVNAVKAYFRRLSESLARDRESKVRNEEDTRIASAQEGDNQQNAQAGGQGSANAQAGNQGSAVQAGSLPTQPDATRRPEAYDPSQDDETILDFGEEDDENGNNGAGKGKENGGGNGDGEDDDFIIEIDDDFLVSAGEIEEGTGKNIADKPYDPRADLSRYKFPTLDLLEDRPSGPVINMEEQQANKRRIEETLSHYNIGISRIEATVGPTVTLYEIVPAEGVRISQIKRLEDDIALSLSAIGIRIIAPIPGKGTVGIEVPNNDPKTVSMYSVINSRKYQESKMALPMAMGATISNDIFIADLAKMPHLLVAGATGMGKSVGLNVIISSLIYKKHPSELKLVLVDPKMVEFSLYSRLERHFLAKLPNADDAIITDMRKVVETLNSLCIEMDNRYELLRDANVRSLEEYNTKFVARRLNPEKGHKYLPYIVVVVDEFADLIMTQGKEVETPIARIAQKARAVGIHMILATQRPSTNVITGLIKANFPGRIAFRVIQMVDSRTILDCPGANQLIGRGDMLFSHNGSMERVQCAFMSTEEVENLVQYIDDQVGYEHAYYLPEYVPEEVEGGPIAGASSERDPLFNEAARFVVTKHIGSTSSLQRQFSIGYSRAGKLMDQLEAAGIVGPVNGSKPRNILVDLIALEMILGEDK